MGPGTGNATNLMNAGFGGASQAGGYASRALGQALPFEMQVARGGLPQWMLSNEQVAAAQGLKGAQGGVVGGAEQRALATRNAGATGMVEDAAAREAMRQQADVNLGIQGQNAQAVLGANKMLAGLGTQEQDIGQKYLTSAAQGVGDVQSAEEQGFLGSKGFLSSAAQNLLSHATKGPLAYA